MKVGYVEGSQHMLGFGLGSHDGTIVFIGANDNVID